jgi:hypothetical protein
MIENPTEKQLESVLQKLKDADPQFDLNIEFGRLLMIHINDFTPEQRNRYDELKVILKQNYGTTK